MDFENIDLIEFNGLTLQRQKDGSQTWILNDLIDKKSLILTMTQIRSLTDILEAILGRDHDGCGSI